MWDVGLWFSVSLGLVLRAPRALEGLDVVVVVVGGGRVVVVVVGGW